MGAQAGVIPGKVEETDDAADLLRRIAHERLVLDFENRKRLGLEPMRHQSRVMTRVVTEVVEIGRVRQVHGREWERIAREARRDEVASHPDDARFGRDAGGETEIAPVLEVLVGDT